MVPGYTRTDLHRNMKGMFQKEIKKKKKMLRRRMVPIIKGLIYMEMRRECFRGKKECFSVN